MANRGFSTITQGHIFAQICGLANNLMVFFIWESHSSHHITLLTDGNDINHAAKQASKIPSFVKVSVLPPLLSKFVVVSGVAVCDAKCVLCGRRRTKQTNTVALFYRHDFNLIGKKLLWKWFSDVAVKSLLRDIPLKSNVRSPKWKEKLNTTSFKQCESQKRKAKFPHKTYKKTFGCLGFSFQFRISSQTYI